MLRNNEIVEIGTRLDYFLRCPQGVMGCMVSVPTSSYLNDFVFGTIAARFTLPKEPLPFRFNGYLLVYIYDFR